MRATSGRSVYLDTETCCVKARYSNRTTPHQVPPHARRPRDAAINFRRISSLTLCFSSRRPAILARRRARPIRPSWPLEMADERLQCSPHREIYRTTIAHRILLRAFAPIPRHRAARRRGRRTRPSGAGALFKHPLRTQDGAVSPDCHHSEEVRARRRSMWRTRSPVRSGNQEEISAVSATDGHLLARSGLPRRRRPLHAHVAPLAERATLSRRLPLHHASSTHDGDRRPPALDSLPALRVRVKGEALCDAVRREATANARHDQQDSAWTLDCSSSSRGAAGTCIADFALDGFRPRPVDHSRRPSASDRPT